MILGMIYLTHDKINLRAIEGKVLDDSKNTIITIGRKMAFSIYFIWLDIYS